MLQKKEQNSICVIFFGHNYFDILRVLSELAISWLTSVHVFLGITTGRNDLGKHCPCNIDFFHVKTGKVSFAFLCGYVCMYVCNVFPSPQQNLNYISEYTLYCQKYWVTPF